MAKEAFFGRLQETILGNLFGRGKSLGQTVLESETNDRLSTFYGTCTPEEIKILQDFFSFLKDKVAGGQLPHLGVLLIGGCADPEKKGRRKDIDLRITTETPRGAKRNSTITDLRQIIPEFFKSRGIGCKVGSPQADTGVPRMVTAYSGGRKIQLLFVPSQYDIATNPTDLLRPLDIFVQSPDDPPLSRHHLVEDSIGGKYITLLDTRKSPLVNFSPRCARIEKWILPDKL